MCSKVKHIIVLLTSAMMLFQGATSIWIMADFFANRAFIAKNQCEKRLISSNTCQGQCVLMKKLQDEQDKKQDQPDIEIKTVQLFVKNLRDSSSDDGYFSKQDVVEIPYSCNLNTDDYLNKVFRPPLLPFGFFIGTLR